MNRSVSVVWYPVLGIFRDVWTRHLPIAEFPQLVTSHTRRAVLATLTSVGLAGCTSSDDPEPSSEAELPDQCPTSLDLDVPWPRDIYTRSVRGFVTRYEAVGEFVTAYEEAYQVEKYAQSQFKSGSFSTRLEQDPEKVANGFHVTVSYNGSVSTEMTLDLEAFEVGSGGIPTDRSRIDIDRSAVPDYSEYISIDEIEDQRLQEVLKSAADSGYKEYTTSSTDHYTQLIENLPSNASLNDHRTGVYFDVNGTPVLLVIYPHGGSVSDTMRWVPVQYYVTEYVIRRTDEESESPEDGTVVECRLPE